MNVSTADPRKTWRRRASLPTLPTLFRRNSDSGSSWGGTRSPRQRWSGRGTRKLYKPLRVPQWESPPRNNSAPSQAAVLFDIAYAASLRQHANMLITRTVNTEDLGHHITKATLLYVAPGTSLLWSWWQISKFWCMFDSGDLLNEFVLVTYMILVVGQAFTIEPCAACVLSSDLQHAYQTDMTSELSCAAELGDADAGFVKGAIPSLVS